MANSQSITMESRHARFSHCWEATNNQWNSLDSTDRRAVVRHARAKRQLELRLPALHTMEQARGVGCSIRNTGESWASGRRGTRCRSDDRAGASACGRGKRANKNQESLGRSRGGFSTRIHLRTNAKGNPLTFDVTGGEVHEIKGFDVLMELHNTCPDKLFGDRGYDSNEFRDDLTARGIEPLILPRSNRRIPIEYDRDVYKRRNRIERCVNRLKQFHRVAARYEKTAREFLSMLCIAAARLWLKTVNTASV